MNLLNLPWGNPKQLEISVRWYVSQHCGYWCLGDKHQAINNYNTQSTHSVRGSFTKMVVLNMNTLRIKIHMKGTIRSRLRVNISLQRILIDIEWVIQNTNFYRRIKLDYLRGGWSIATMVISGIRVTLWKLHIKCKCIGYLSIYALSIRWLY